MTAVPSRNAVRASRHASIVVGGGLAGAAVACQLAQAGQPVLVLERDAAPADRICGEFLSAEAVRHLGRLGIDLPALGAAPIARVRLVRGGAVVSVALPAPAFGLSRRVLDPAVLARAQSHGAEIRRGLAVSHVEPGAPAIVTAAGLGEIRADTLFLATGKHDLRGLRRPVAAEPEDLVGFKQHLRLAPDQAAGLAGHVEIVLLPDGYAGLQPIEDGQANLCLLVRRHRLLRAGGWDGLLADLCAREPHLGARLAGAAPLIPRPLSIARVPYGFVHPAAGDLPGIFRLGDQMAVIPSYTGGGMAIALHSAMRAAQSHLAGEAAAVYAARMRRDVGGQIARATTLYRIGSSAPGQATLMRLAAAWPGLLGLAVRLTRLRAPATAWSAAHWAAA